MTDNITLVSSDGHEFMVLLEVANRSKTIRDLVEDAGVGHPVPLPTVDGKTLERVVAYCMHHKDDPVVVEEKKTDEKKLELSEKPMEISTWDKSFTNVELEVIFQLILAANYLDVRPLLDLCCRVIALQVLGKTPDAIYDLFGVTEKLTEEEEKQVLAENPWLADQ